MRRCPDGGGSAGCADEATADQGRLVLQCQGTFCSLEKAIEPWREQDLDRDRYPDGMLGFSLRIQTDD